MGVTRAGSGLLQCLRELGMQFLEVICLLPDVHAIRDGGDEVVHGGGHGGKGECVVWFVRSAGRVANAEIGLRSKVASWLSRKVAAWARGGPDRNDRCSIQGPAGRVDHGQIRGARKRV